MSEGEFVQCTHCRRGFSLNIPFQNISDSDFFENTICLPCTKVLKKNYQKKLKELEKELETVEETYKILCEIEEEEIEDDNININEVDDFLDYFEEQRYHQIESEEIDKLILKYEREYDEVGEMYERFWTQFKNFLVLSRGEILYKHGITIKLKDFSRTLYQLNCRNVLNDAFYICMKSSENQRNKYRDYNLFASINTFRLGRLRKRRGKKYKIRWKEINMAFGECAMLMYVISRTYNIPLTNCKILPKGSSSLILKDSVTYSLFYDESYPYYFLEKFNKAMSSFVSCVQEIGNYFAFEEEEEEDGMDKEGREAEVEGDVDEEREETMMERRFQFPYPIIGSNIGQVSVKYERNSEEKWSRALNFLLINLKFLVYKISQIRKHPHLLLQLEQQLQMQQQIHQQQLDEEGEEEEEEEENGFHKNKNSHELESNL